jgi:hypothetical protein
MFCPDPFLAYEPMFSHREEISVPSPTVQARLRAELRDRLRLAAEFATLGAYELSEPAAEAHGDTPHARDGVPTRRVFLFSRVPEPRCARSAETTEVCPATSASRIPRHVRPSERRRVARRRGGIEAAQQPCTASVVETAKSRPAR